MASLEQYTYTIAPSSSDVYIADIDFTVTVEVDLFDHRNYNEIIGSEDLAAFVAAGNIIVIMDTLPSSSADLSRIGILNGDTFLFLYDPIRDMWVSSNEMIFSFAENKISRNDWFLNQNNAIDREMARGCKHNLVVTGFRAQCENAEGNTKGVHLYRNTEDDGILWTTQPQTNYQEEYIRDLSLIFLEGDGIRLRGDSSSTRIQDTDITLYYRYML